MFNLMLQCQSWTFSSSDWTTPTFDNNSEQCLLGWKEGIRRLRNTRRTLPWADKAEILSEFLHSIMSSTDWRSSQRLCVTGFERQCARADRGGTPVHRPCHYDYKEAEEIDIKNEVVSATQCRGVLPTNLWQHFIEENSGSGDKKCVKTGFVSEMYWDCWWSSISEVNGQSYSQTGSHWLYPLWHIQHI